MNEQSLFAAALAKKAGDERETFLREACGPNTALLAQVEELLKADATAGSFLEHPPAGLDVTIEANLSGKDTVDAGLRSSGLTFLAPSDKPDRLGKLVGRGGEYEVTELVGQGGMGSVLRAVDTKLSRVVAVKVMAPELAANPEAVKRFLREAQTAAAVHHDHVVTIHAIEEQHRPPFLVMQFVQGQTLQQKIDKEGALEIKSILRIGSQMAAGLAAAHKTGLIHRDVKPGNILLENGVERVKITDFGLARAADDVEMTKAGMIAGTPQYMSPEQANGGQIDFRSDLFSLGSVLYTMCTGRPAFRAETTMATLRRVTEEAPRPIREVNPEIPEWLEAIVLKLLAKNPDERFQTAKEVSELLEQHLAHLQQPGKVPLPPPVEKPRRADTTLAAGPKRWRPWVAISVAVLLAAWVALWFGPAALLYVTNTCKLTLSKHPDFDEFLVVPANSASTPWKVKPGSTLTLPPGNYRVEAVGRQGEVISRWDVHGASMFMGYGTQAEGAQFHANIGRGERVMLSIAKTEPKTKAADPVRDGWTQLFNGQDLGGWKTLPDMPGYWKVENGILAGYGPQSYLFSERGNYKDFRLRVEARINAAGDSGVFFRTPFWAPSWPRKGHEANICGTAKEGTGSIFNQHDPTWWKTAIPGLTRPDEWFVMEIIVQGNHYQVKLNDQLAMDFTDAEEAYKEGHIALQQYTPETRVQFRKVEIKELPASLPLTPEDKKRHDLARLKGPWKVTAVSVDGDKRPATELFPMELHFGSNPPTFELRRSDLAERWEGTFGIDAEKAELLLQLNAGRAPVRGSYSFAGERLTLDFPKPRDFNFGSTEPFVPDARVASLTNLKQLGLSMHVYHDASTALPQAAITDPKDKDRKPLLSWRVALLPYLDQSELYRQFKLDESWDSERNKQLIDKMPKVFAPPGLKHNQPGMTHYQVFVGPGAAFEPRQTGDQGTGLGGFKDGTSNTFLIVETCEPVIWTKPDDLPFDPTKPLPKLGWARDGALACMGDGSVARLAPDAPDETTKAYITRNGEELVTDDFLQRSPLNGPALVLELRRIEIQELVPAEASNGETVVATLKPGRDKPISAEFTDAGADGWLFSTEAWKGFRLLELREPKLENCRLIARIRMKSAEAREAYPRLIARFPGGDAKDTIGSPAVAARGDTNWTIYEVALDLKKGERPELVELGLHMEGKGTSDTDKAKKNQVWVKDVELLCAPRKQ